MLRKIHSEGLFIIIILLNLVILVVVITLLQSLYPTGFFIAEGGKVTELNASSPLDPNAWALVYGNLSLINGNTSLNLTQKEIVEINVKRNFITNNSWIVASIQSNINLENLTPGNLSVVDKFMNLSSDYYYSATRTFKDLINYSFAGKEYMVYSLRTLPYSSNFTLALFQYNSTPVFITKARFNSTSFNNKKTDFQMLLPLSPGSNRYYFEHFTNDTLNLSCPETFNLNYSFINYTDLYINWEPVWWAKQYVIYYIDNITDPGDANSYKFDFSSAQTIITNKTNYTFYNITQFKERYIRVRIADPKICLTNETIGFMNLDLYNNYGTNLNLISFPFDYNGKTLTEILKPIYPQLTIAYWYNNIIKGYYAFMVIDAGAGNYIAIDNVGPLNNYNAYWVGVKQNVTLPLAGKLLNSTNFNLTPSLNLVSFHIAEDNLVTNVFQQVYANLTNVYWYDNLRKGYYSFVIIPDSSGGYIPITLFDYIYKANGYYVNIKSNSTMRWPND